MMGQGTEGRQSAAGWKRTGLVEPASLRLQVSVGLSEVTCDSQLSQGARAGSHSVFCAGEHEANHLHRYSTFTPTMSYLEPSPSSLQPKEIIGQGAMSGKSQQQRYASLSCLCLSALRVNLAHGQQLVYHIDPHP
jgi:hypothetical protein